MDINHNVNRLILALKNKLGLFGEDGGSNAEDKSKGRLGDWEGTEKQPKEGPRKYQPSWIGVNHSQSLFNIKVKPDIKPHQGEINALKLNYSLQQLEMHFSVHKIFHWNDWN